jgi:hypothetical protein
LIFGFGFCVFLLADDGIRDAHYFFFQAEDGIRDTHT